MLCCHVEVSASGRSLVQRSPTEHGVSECDLETSTIKDVLDSPELSRHKKNMINSKCAVSGFGSLEVACWPLVPKFAGPNPAEAVGFFQGEKILGTPSFGGEVKPSVPCRRFTACKRPMNATWKSGISGKIVRPFLAHIVPPLATRISGETTSGEGWNVYK